MRWGEESDIIINMLLSVRFLLKIQPVYTLKLIHTSFLKYDLRFSLLCSWKLKSSGMWYCVTGWAVTNILWGPSKWKDLYNQWYSVTSLKNWTSTECNSYWQGKIIWCRDCLCKDISEMMYIILGLPKELCNTFYTCQNQQKMSAIFPVVNFWCPSSYCRKTEQYICFQTHWGSSKWHGIVTAF